MPPGRAQPLATHFATVCVAAGVALLLSGSLPWTAAGLEAVSIGFWLWSRDSRDAGEQLARWAWLRRPATALWLAAGLAAVLPAGPGAMVAAPGPPLLTAALPASARDPWLPLRALEAFAVLWAGLELLGASPTNRPYPDLPGPRGGLGPWLTALLPGAGFLVLWRLLPVWTVAPLVREIATLALVFGAGVAVLRAYVRRTWSASLRWLAVADCAVAALLVPVADVPPWSALLLWVGAFGGRLVALAGELHGAVIRRGHDVARLWRYATWLASTCLTWPLLVALGFRGGRIEPIAFALLALPVALATSLALRRPAEAPERRLAPRVDPVRGASLAGAVIVLLTGPAALVTAWWRGFEASFPGAIVALLPSLVAFLPRAAAPVPAADAEPAAEAPRWARELAVSVFRGLTAFERQLSGAIGALLRGLGAPARDLHTGDAQEYLLFLVGVALLALAIPLLR